MNIDLLTNAKWLSDPKYPLMDGGFFANLGSTKNDQFDSDWDYNTKSSSFTKQVDLPGCKRENISLELDFLCNKLSINSFRVLNGSTIKINKYVNLPKNADSTKIKASLEDGVLTLVVESKASQPNITLKKINID
jgi:HSP20 family molecular chaperone IbpA